MRKRISSLEGSLNVGKTVCNLVEAITVYLKVMLWKHTFSANMENNVQGLIYKQLNRTYP